MSKTKTPSKSSPKGGRRGCLCDNGTYSSKCCDGSLQAQGIGTTTGTENVTVTISSGVTTIVRQNG